MGIQIVWSFADILLLMNYNWVMRAISLIAIYSPGEDYALCFKVIICFVSNINSNESFNIL